MNYIPEFMKDATNVYRTDQYIVGQCVMLRGDEEYGSYLFSRDTYYLRTRKRDRDYDAIFAGRRNVNGKRIRAAAYTRTYID